MPLAQAPQLVQRQHALALMQGASIVDTFALSLNECVIDTEVLYFNADEYITLPGAIMALKTTERRVFVTACTAMVEKRGEDTQQ